MTHQEWIIAALVGLPVLWLLIAGALVLRSGRHDRFSVILRRWGRRWPAFVMVISFLVGLLFGHFWW